MRFGAKGLFFSVHSNLCVLSGIQLAHEVENNAGRANPIGPDSRTQRFSGEMSLVHKAQAGDFHAYEQLYRLHVGRVYALCLRMVANKSWAEELTQDSFVRVWEMIGSFRGDSLFSSWLHRVVVNTVLVAKRSKRRLLARIFSTPDLHAFDVGRHESQPGNNMDLEHAIAGLPPQARIIFVLHDVEGYRHEEIAEKMGLAVGTSKAQLHRARRILREVLEQ